MTIYEIKRRTEDTQPYFFTRNNLKFVHQTLKMFSVTKYDTNRYLISAPRRDRNGRKMGYTQRLFNTVTNRLEFIKD